MKFSSDCRHLITVSADRYVPHGPTRVPHWDNFDLFPSDFKASLVCVSSCIFVWRLNPELTIRMKQRLADLQPDQLISNSQNAPHQKAVKPRYVTFDVTPTLREN